MLLKLKIALVVYATAVASASALKCKAYFGSGPADVDIATPTTLCSADAVAAEKAAGQACVVSDKDACEAHTPACFWEDDCLGAKDCYRSQEQQHVSLGGVFHCAALRPC